MVDVEFRVVSDRRDGLLLALGQVVIANGFTLLRQRMLNSDEGVVLVMVVRGPADALLMLEEKLGTHHLVQSFEASPYEPAPSAPAAAPAPVARNNGNGYAGQTSAAAAPVAQAGSAAGHAAAPIDTQRVETLLPQLARNYPNILLQLVALERELPPAQREATLRYIGQRVGAWVYKRDFALGGQLPLADSVRRIALPAMRQLVQAELHDDVLRVRNSPFCHRGESGECCHFLRGMLGGLLEGQHGTHVHVVESQCRNTGAETCRFEFES
ncbi:MULTISPECIES: 4-vinyl reductase [unclassified Lysobacter]|uniref:V4R domain-containing protein n=1 Tax=unclassified Lysobacter TaxID=2635362 RepID=UPI001BEC100D|nr:MULTISPECIES: 4-vinyl reductase [unclassified Lysobacter]MBT2749247.1 4-vinyl reductase [Lysobacter sp. ISL-42]MBT2754208.1 4-vinyl reductase [Lysobacter sp. ISL-50]MBT2779582.1 4-vinyl reductase [Lysobacter sp. ISL-54]MBT2784708.1 4-vinyl reductase [Lysobacter sp. ISL-52]